MLTTDAQPAASSAAETPAQTPPTAADAAVASKDVAAFREARRAERSGKPLDAKPAESSPAQPDGQAASTEVTEAASEAAKPRKNAEDRVKELLADRARERERADRLEREIAEFRTRTQAPAAKPAESAPAPESETFPDYDAWTGQHPDGTYEQYIRELSRHEADQRWMERERESSARTALEKQSQSVRERDAKFRRQLDAAGGDEFLAGLSEDVSRLRPSNAIRDERGRWTEQPTGYHALTDEILASDVAPQLLRHFTDHPDDLHRIARSASPSVLYREFGKLEARLSQGATKAAAPAPKPVTDAPAPPTTLSTRTSSTVTDADAAVAAGDVAAFRAARAAERRAQIGR